MSRLNSIWKFIGRFRYWIVGIFCVLIVVVFDENSILQHVRNKMVVRDLKEQIEEYNNRYEQDKIKLKELKESHNAVMKIAREKYFMKADDEDIFVLRDEKSPSPTEANN